MELKKKTIIWEDNTEPPKDYIWVKSDGKAYEFDYNNRKWKESQIVSSINSGNSDGNGSNLENVISKNWKLCEIIPIEQYNSIHIHDDVIAEKNIPEDSVAVAFCTMNNSGEPSPKSLYIYGLTESEADLLNSANLEMDVSEFPVDCCLEIEKVNRGDKDFFNIVNVTPYHFNDPLDFSNENKFYVGCCQKSMFYQKPLLSRFITEKNEVDKNSIFISAMNVASKTEDKASGLTTYLKERIEKLYSVGTGLYLGTLTVNDTNIILGFSLSRLG